MTLKYEDIHARAMAIWQERESRFPPRVQRMRPDDLDRASGAWGTVFEQAARELGWHPGDEISAATPPNIKGGFGVTEQEQRVWLVWGLTRHDRLDLVAVTTTEEIRDKYVNGAERRGEYQRVHSEQVLCDHLFGQGMLRAFMGGRGKQ